MKKIVLMMLVAMIPFLTMAQKRSKKGKKVKTEKVVESNSSYDFMVITGDETTLKAEGRSDIKASKPVDLKSREMMKTKMKIHFDFGGIKSPENIKLMKNSRGYRTMAAAVNGSANEGWEFISANVIRGKVVTTHYYYMKRNK
tara:strand:+ start:96 stop:524 length:429 start_codon:yes stop_codon:yes gene_type:complete